MAVTHLVASVKTMGVCELVLCMRLCALCGYQNPACWRREREREGFALCLNE